MNIIKNISNITLMQAEYLIITVTVLFMYSDSLRAQDVDMHSKGITAGNYIPSPDAYSIMQYSEIPVSLYTGVPEISIPLYDVTVGDFNLPITLRYHSSGIKIAQESSRVGLGWSLFAGGSISRVIRGHDDLFGNRDYNGSHMEDSSSRSGYWKNTDLLEQGLGINLAELALNNFLFTPLFPDGEPDIFHYNFGSYSGVFYAKKGAGATNEPDKFVLRDISDNIKITFDEDDSKDGYGKFTIKTPDGVQYVFDDANEEISVSQVTKYSEISHGSFVDRPLYGFYPLNDAYIGGYGKVATTWELTEIILPSGEKIEFNYNQLFNDYFSPVFNFYSEYEEASKSDIILTGEDSYTSIPESTINQSATVMLMNKAIQSITWAGGRVSFEYSKDSRKDIRTFGKGVYYKNYYDAKSLSGISISNGKQNILNYELHQSYFGENKNVPQDTRYTYLNYRLRLDSISIYGKNSSNRQKYYMEYYDSVNINGVNKKVSLPRKNSNYCDEWGYYTGIDSEALFTSFRAGRDYLKKNTNQPFIKKGDEFFRNKSFHKPNWEYARIWTLSALTTPTGARTEFTYGGHQLCNLKETGVRSGEICSFTCERATVLLDEYDEESFSDTTFFIPYNSGQLNISCEYTGTLPDRINEEILFELKNTEGMPILIQRGLPQNYKMEQYAETLISFNVNIDFCGSGEYKISLPIKRKWARAFKVRCEAFETVPNTVTEEILISSNKLFEFESSRPSLSDNYDETAVTMHNFNIPLKNTRLIFSCEYMGGTPDKVAAIPLVQIKAADGRIVFVQTGLPANHNSKQYTEYCADFSFALDTLPPGDYTITLPVHRYWLRRMAVSCVMQEIEHLEKLNPVYAGGIRIEKIVSPIGTRRFEYLNEKDNSGWKMSSGQLNRQSVYAIPMVGICYKATTGGGKSLSSPSGYARIFYPYAYTYYIRNNSTPCRPLENPHGGDRFGYSSVQVYHEDTYGNSITKDAYYFYNQKEKAIVDFADAGSYMPLNGKQCMSIHWNNGKKERVTSTRYNVYQGETIEEIHQYGSQRTWITITPCHQGRYLYSMYDAEPVNKIKTYLVQCRQETSCIMDIETGVELKEEKTYDYNKDNYRVSRSTIRTNGVPELTQEYMYPVDFPNDIISARMTREHFVDMPVIVTTYRDNVITERIIKRYNRQYPYNLAREYKLHDGDTYNVSLNDDFLGTLIPEMEYQYNPSSKPIQIITRGGASTVLLWGYNNQHVIAKIENAAIQDIIAQIGITHVSADGSIDWERIHRLRNLLPDSKVTTCKYEPLVGPVEITDPSGRTKRFGYDSFNRLCEIAEVDGEHENIFQKYEYKYATEN